MGNILQKTRNKNSNGKHIQIIVFPKPQRIYSEWDFKDTPINHHLEANSGLDWIILSDSESSAGAVLKDFNQDSFELEGRWESVYLMC